LEAICLQTREILDAIGQDSNTTFSSLKVDGGLTNNDVCMQIQADLLGVDVGKYYCVYSISFLFIFLKYQ